MAGYEHLRALAQSATPGPWAVDGPWWHDNGDASAMVTVSGRRAVVIGPPRHHRSERSEADCRFIAAASPDVVLPLIADVDQARAENDVLQARLDAVLAKVSEWNEASKDRLDGLPTTWIVADLDLLLDAGLPQFTRGEDQK